MLRKININTALLICTAFIFRLLFVNIGLVSSLNSGQNNNTVKRHFSTVIKKRRKQFEAVNAKNFGYSAVEILEEDSNDEEQFKLNPFTLLFLFYSKIEIKIKETLKKITPFNKHFSFNSSHRYVEYRVFRI